MYQCFMHCRGPGLLTLVFLLSGSGCGKTKDVDFSQADSVAEVTFQCTGTCGDIMLATVTGKIPEKIHFQVTRGTILKGLDKQEDLALVSYRGKALQQGKFDPRTPFTIPSGGTMQVSLEGYSLQAFAPAGMGMTRYKIEGQVKDKTLAVFNALADSDSISAKQFAVWALTDNISKQAGLKLLPNANEADVAAAKGILERASLQPDDFELFNPKKGKKG